MMVDWLILVPLVVGHLALFVLALNVSHSTEHAGEAARRPEPRPPAGAPSVALPFLVTAGPVDRPGRWSPGPMPCSAWRSRWSACRP